jgi:DNA topoisomerase-6 subunit B
MFKNSGLIGINMGIAEEMGKKQREISVSEFFEKNRHLLGYDNKAKATLMIVKEGVDNSLDAAEEARILPEIFVGIKEVGPDQHQITIRDNGPGIVREQIPKIFGTLLYGSKFHRLRQARGQQGLGISCAVLYSQFTTGNPTSVVSSTGDGKTHRYQLKIDVAKNRPIVVETTAEEGRQWHGVEVSFIAECAYRESRQSVLEYLKQTAISNPYADIVFDSPTGRIEFKRGVDRLPPEPCEIMPHMHGVELGVLDRMLASTKARTILSFLTTEFSRLGKTSACEILLKAGITKEEGGKMVPYTKLKPGKLSDEQARAIIEAVKHVKLMRPPTGCLSPLGTDLVKSGLVKELNPEFVTSVTRSPEVYRGWPFQVEAGLAFGGSVQSFSLMRFANRVPLLYQQGICAIAKAVEETDWKRYGLQMNKEIEEPLAIFVHLCSVWVPFTSESKEAIATYERIIKEIKLALQECARDLSLWLSGKRKKAMLSRKKSTFERYAGETAKAIGELTGIQQKDIQNKILNMITNKWGEINGEEAEEDAEGEDQGTGE